MRYPRNALILATAGLFGVLGLSAVQATSWPASTPVEQRVLPRAGEVVDHRRVPLKREGPSFVEPAADGSLQIWDAASWAAAHPAPKARTVTKVTGEGPTFEIEYLDVTNNTGAGFDDPQLGQARRDTAESVFLYLSDLLAEHAGGMADIEFQVSESDGSGPLGQGGPFYFCRDGFEFGLPREHIVTGQDPSPSVPDAQITMDFGHSFNNQLDNPTQGEFDLASTILHEATHALGFLAGGIDPETGAVMDCEGGGSPTKTATEFVRYLHRSGDGRQLWQATGPGGGVQFKGKPADVAGESAPVDFRGSPPTSPVDIFSGDLGHWADSVIVGGARPVMLTAQLNGERRREYLSWEQQVLADMGYSQSGGPVTVLAPGSLAGAWLEPNRSGEGFLIDIVELPGGGFLVFVAWFTYDEDGNQQWLVAQTGTLQELSFDEPLEMLVQRVTGPSFSNFDPGDQVPEAWGSMILTFQDCTNATVEFDSDVGFGSGTFEIIRLTPGGLSGVNCQ